VCEREVDMCMCVCEREICGMRRERDREEFARLKKVKAAIEKRKLNA